MELRLLVCTIVPVWHILLSSQTIAGQCPITEVTVEFYAAQHFDFRNVNELTFVANGDVQGGTPSTFKWKWNNTLLSPAFSIRSLPGVTDGTFYIGGDNINSNPCSKTSFRTAVEITGRAPGEYSLSLHNVDMATDITRSTIIYDSDPVTGLTLTQFNDVRLQVSWTAPINTGPDMELVDYRVFINNEDINSNGTIVPAGTTTYTLPGTYTPGTTVTVHVRATSRHYWSETRTQQYTLLGVSIPVITSSTPMATSVTLTMSQPNTPPGISTDQYIATLTSSACPDVPTRMGTTTSNSVTVSNLEAGIQYTASVLASNTNYGYNSNATTTTITTLSTGPTGSPGVPTRSDSTSTTITLTWTEIDCIQRNGVIAYYIIQYGEGTNRNMMANTSSSSLTYTISSLKPYTEYTCTVAGATSVGTGPASASGVIRTNEDVPTAVQNLTNTSDLISVLLSWCAPFPPNGAITNYIITYSINGSSTITSTSNTTSFKITGLLPHTTVSGITVTASTSVGPGPALSLHDVMTHDKLPRIQNIMVIILTDTSVRVSWEDPQFSSIIYYEIKYTVQGNTTRQALSVKVEAPATSAEVTGLKNNAQITFQVIAFAEVDGVLISGDPSVINNVFMLKAHTSSVVYEDNAANISIYSIVTFFGAIFLYSIILVVVIVFCFCYKRQRDRRKSQNMVMKDCEAYGHIDILGSDLNYEVLTDFQ